jgi:hypothetical protein
VRPQASPAEFEPAKKENCLTYDSVSSAVRADAAPIAGSFYVEEEQEEDRVSCSSDAPFAIGESCSVMPDKPLASDGTRSARSGYRINHDP